MSTPVRIIGFVAALVAATGLMTAPASAAVRTFDDPPGRPGAIDIRAVRVDNSTTRTHRVVVTVPMRSIRFGDGMTVHVDTRPRDAGPEYRIDGLANSEYAFRRTGSWSARGRVVPCDDARFRLAAGERRARVVFPRSCLDGPGRVRIAVHAYRDGRSDWARAARHWLGFVRR